MLRLLFILLLAWAFGSVITDLDTAGFVSQALGNNMPIKLMPLIAGSLSMAMSLAIGSTWGDGAAMPSAPADCCGRYYDHHAATGAADRCEAGYVSTIASCRRVRSGGRG